MNMNLYIGNLLNTIEKNKKWHFWIFIAVLCVLTLFMMYRYSSFVSIGHGHDAPFQFNRFVKLVDALKNGTFPVYIDEGVKQYGYATKLFYPDFILIPFAYIGTYIGYVKSYQLVYFIATISCGLISYISVKNIYKNEIAGYISAILYTFCLYRLQDLYDRGALAEAISFSFIPLIFWGIYEITKGDYKKWYIVCIGFSLCILTHVLSSLMIGILVSIIVIICIKDFINEPKRLVYLIIAAVSTIIISGYYIFPYIEQILNDSFNYQNSTLPEKFTLSGQKIIQGLFIIGITDGRYSGFFPSIGLTLTLPLFFRLYISEKSKYIKIADLAVIAAFILIVFTFDNFSFSFYEKIKLFSIIQFSWRFFVYVSFFLSMACGLYLSILIKSNKRSILLLASLLMMIVIMIIMSSTAYNYRGSNPYKTYISKDLETLKKNIYYLGASDKSEYFPIPVSITEIENRKELIAKEHPDTKIGNIERVNTNLSFNITINENELLELPIVYYKGYYARLNGKEIAIQKSENGFVQIPINQSGKVSVEFTGTPIQKYSIYVTIISAFLLCIYIYLYNRKLKKTNQTNHVNTVI